MYMTAPEVLITVVVVVVAFHFSPRLLLIYPPSNLVSLFATIFTSSRRLA